MLMGALLVSYADRPRGREVSTRPDLAVMGLTSSVRPLLETATLPQHGCSAHVTASSPVLRRERRGPFTGLGLTGGARSAGQFLAAAVPRSEAAWPADSPRPGPGVPTSKWITSPGTVYSACHPAVLPRRTPPSPPVPDGGPADSGNIGHDGPGPASRMTFGRPAARIRQRVRSAFGHCGVRAFGGHW